MPPTDHATATARSGRRLWTLALLLLIALGMLAPPAGGAPSDRSTEPVLTIPPPGPPEVVGSSTLVRTDRGVSVRLESSQLEPGHVVTLWWIVANDPDDCRAGLPGLSQCGPGDHVAGRGEVSVHHGAGRIVGEDGTASYGAHLRVGDRSRGLFEGEPGLTDARDAEVLLVLKTHGPKIARMTSEMLRTFTGGCQIDDALEEELEQLPPPRAEVFGTEGPNEGCAEIQVSVHSPE